MLLNISCYLHCLFLDQKTEKVRYKILNFFLSFPEAKRSFVEPYSEVGDVLKESQELALYSCVQLTNYQPAEDMQKGGTCSQEPGLNWYKLARCLREGAVLRRPHPSKQLLFSRKILTERQSRTLNQAETA